MKILPSYLCVFVDSNDMVSLSSIFTPEFLTKEEMTSVLKEFKEYKKDLLDSYDNNTYKKEDVEETLTIKDKISLIYNSIKDYEKSKKVILDSKILIEKIENLNKNLDEYLKRDC